MSEKTNSPKKSSNRLYREVNNKVLAGVSSGIGKYFHIDPTIIRIIFVVLIFFGGSGVILYLILWAIIPPHSNNSKNDAETIRGNLEEMQQSIKSMLSGKSRGDKNKSLLAIILVILGVLFLFDNLNIFRFDFGTLWPILLIILGFLLLRRR